MSISYLSGSRKEESNGNVKRSWKRKSSNSGDDEDDKDYIEININVIFIFLKYLGIIN